MLTLPCCEYVFHCWIDVALPSLLSAGSPDWFSDVCLDPACRGARGLFRQSNPRGGRSLAPPGSRTRGAGNRHGRTPAEGVDLLQSAPGGVRRAGASSVRRHGVGGDRPLDRRAGRPVRPPSVAPAARLVSPDRRCGTVGPRRALGTVARRLDRGRPHGRPNRDPSPGEAVAHRALLRGPRARRASRWHYPTACLPRLDLPCARAAGAGSGGARDGPVYGRRWTGVVPRGVPAADFVGGGRRGPSDHFMGGPVAARGRGGRRLPLLRAGGDVSSTTPYPLPRRRGRTFPGPFRAGVRSAGPGLRAAGPFGGRLNIKLDLVQPGIGVRQHKQTAPNETKSRQNGSSCPAGLPPLCPCWFHHWPCVPLFNVHTWRKASLLLIGMLLAPGPRTVSACLHRWLPDLGPSTCCDR